jgi:hypothetical protein
MNRATKLSRLGVAIVMAIVGVALGATPAHADAGFTRYENVGNPTWCMYADWAGPRLKRCSGNTQGTLWSWYAEPTGQYQGLIMLTSEYTQSTCLTALPSGLVTTTYCSSGRADQHWDVWGRNGWVVYQEPGTLRCIRPVGTEVVATDYPLRLEPCPLDRNNVPNIFAWRYF